MIHILDELSVLPGHLAEVRDRFKTVYFPIVVPLGMRSTHIWISPAVELRADPTDLVLLWEVDGQDAFWTVKFGTSRNPDVMAFWQGLTPFLVARRRRIMVDPDDTTLSS